MEVLERSGMSGKRKLYLVLAIIAGIVAALFYIEQLAVLYIGGVVLSLVLLILAAFSDIEEASIHATEEAYMTTKSEGVLENEAVRLGAGHDTDAANKRTERPALSVLRNQDS